MNACGAATLGSEARVEYGLFALATALLAHYRAGLLSKALESGTFDGFLKLYGQYYPAQVAGIVVLKKGAEALFEHLLATQPALVLQESFAYVLRQYAIDAGLANPKVYPSLFVERKKGGIVSPTDLRRRGAWLDPAALRACAQKLNFSLQIDCGIFQRYLHRVESCEQPLVLRFTSTGFSAKIVDETYFLSGRASLPVIRQWTRPEVPTSALHRDPSLAELRRHWAKDRWQDTMVAERLEPCQTNLLIGFYLEQLQFARADYLLGTLAFASQSDETRAWVNIVLTGDCSPAQEYWVRPLLITALTQQTHYDYSFFQEVMKLPIPESPFWLASCRAGSLTNRSHQEDCPSLTNKKQSVTSQPNWIKSRRLPAWVARKSSV